MRVVAGTARGRRLEAPRGRATRPTADRVRQASFNALHSLGLVEGAGVLDLFAGSGALGIEALSRGAAWAVFVDHDRAALAAVRANLAATGLGASAEVVEGDALGFLQVSRRAFDLALLDPPYRFDDWPTVLEGVVATSVLVESDVSVPLGDRWDVLREKRYGGTVVTLARRRAFLDGRGAPGRAADATERL